MRLFSFITCFIASICALYTSTAIAEEANTEEQTSTVDSSQEPELELETVEITADKEPKAKINTEKLLKIPGAGNDPLQAIEALPGVTFTKGRGAGQPAIRGSSPKDNRYIVDFMPVGYVFHSDGSSIISDNLIKDFELETAAFEGQYNDANGAIIDVDSRSPYYDESRVVLDLGLLKTGLFVEAPLAENHSFYFSIRRSLIQYYLKLLFSDNDQFKFTTFPNYYDYQAKYEYRVSNLEKINFNLVGSTDEAAIFFKEDNDATKQDPEVTGDFEFKNKYDSQSIVWDKFYDTGVQQKIGVSRLLQKFRLKLGPNNKLDVISTNYNLRSQFAYPVSTNHELQWGLEYKREQIKYVSRLSIVPSDEFSTDKKLSDSKEIISAQDNPVINNYDLNIGDKISVTNAWTLTPALVFSYDDYTKENFADPRIQSRFELSPYWALTSAYGKHHQFQDFAYFSKGFGNPKLKQETSDHYEIGIENTINENWFWKLEAYYKELHKLSTARIDQSFYPNLSDAQYLELPRYTNDAKGQAWGMELFINKTTNENWYGWLSIAYSKTERTHLLTKKNFRYNTDQPWILNLVANYRLKSQWELGLKWRLQSGQLITPVVGATQGLNPKYPEIYTPIYGDINSVRLPFYSKVDLRAQKNYRFNSWELGVYFDVLNALGTNNIVGYSYESKEDYSEREDIPDFPAFFAMGFKATF